MEIIFISGIFMSFFIAVLLLTKKPKALTDKILATWIVIIGIHILGYYLQQLGLWEKYPHLIGVTAPVPLFHGPMLFLYCLYAYRNDRSLRRIDYLHFIPVIISYTYMMKFFFFYSPQQKRMVDKAEINDYSTFAVILLFAILISGLTYAILSYRLTIKHKHKIEKHFSYKEGISLKWLRYCIIGIGLVFISAIIVFLMRDALEIPFSFNPEYIIYTIMIGFIFYIGFFGIKHENIFISMPPAGTNGTVESADINPERKYKKSGLTKELANELYEKLLKIIKDEKPYLEPKLTLADLAGKMNISSNQLSQVINQEANANFHDFINSYRVEEFIMKARENNNFSLLALAYDSGFNSKSSFNNIFKKHKGLSPSKYLDLEKKQQ